MLWCGIVFCVVLMFGVYWAFWMWVYSFHQILKNAGHWYFKMFLPVLSCLLPSGHIHASIRWFEVVPPLTDVLFILFLFLFFNHGKIYIAKYCNHFEVHNSVALSTFTLLCTHYYHPFPELFHHPKWKLVIPLCLLLLSPWKLLSAFCLYEFDLIQSESYNICPFVSDLFHLAQGLQDSF